MVVRAMQICRMCFRPRALSPYWWPKHVPLTTARLLDLAILYAVFKMIVAGLLDVSTVPFRPKAASTPPRACPLARLDECRAAVGPPARPTASCS
jgi:hypothetical protein